MCDKHSFVMDRQGKIYNGGGFEESHTVISLMNGVKQDSVNAYEWQPPENWPDADPWDGVRKDQINFTEKGSHVDAVSAYLKKLFPTKEAFDTYFIDESWHLKEIETSQGKGLILCKPELVVVTAEMLPVRAYGQAQMILESGATVQEMLDSSTVQKMLGSSTVQKMLGSSTVQEMWGSSTVQEMWDSSTVQKMLDSSTVQEMLGSSTVQKMWGSSTVQKMLGSSTVQKMLGSSTVQKMLDSSTVQKMWGSSTVQEMWDSSTVIKWGQKSQIEKMADLAVLIDRSESGKVTVKKARK